jgi:hypothetical protein
MGLHAPDQALEEARSLKPFEENDMIKRAGWLAVVLAVLVVGVAVAQQHPILDMLATKVTQKYQQSTCEQLWEQRGKPKSAQEQEVITMLRGDPSDAHRIHQQDRCARGQQDVRMRYDPVTIAGCDRREASARRRR